MIFCQPAPKHRDLNPVQAQLYGNRQLVIAAIAALAVTAIAFRTFARREMAPSERDQLISGWIKSPDGIRLDLEYTMGKPLADLLARVPDDQLIDLQLAVYRYVSAERAKLVGTAFSEMGEAVLDWNLDKWQAWASTHPLLELTASNELIDRMHASFQRYCTEQLSYGSLWIVPPTPWAELKIRRVVQFHPVVKKICNGALKQPSFSDLERSVSLLASKRQAKLLKTLELLDPATRVFYDQIIAKF